MHPYDPPRAPYHPSTVTPLRPARDRQSAPAASHTPIFDTLYSEYLRAFRTLPGDRTGEEDLGFTAFSYGGAHYASPGESPYGSGSLSGSGWSPAWQQTEAWQPSYVPQPAYSYAGQSVTAQHAAPAPAAGYGNGRQHQTGTHHVPAALPPAPRRGY
ncbi:hypothetical protein ACIQF5_25915 [Streptomyces goshikiensis]|uniref:hypothetical protein n=1 Tax=Streptomyces goshikiensis TaxID=1942 RepID=UPI00382E5B16